jgi:hypothetical protein
MVLQNADMRSRRSVHRGIGRSGGRITHQNGYDGAGVTGGRRSATYSESPEYMAGRAFALAGSQCGGLHVACFTYWAGGREGSKRWHTLRRLPLPVFRRGGYDLSVC